MNKYVKITCAVILVCLCFFAYLCWSFIRNDNFNQAAKSGDLEKCRSYVQEGYDVNGAGMHAMTPIMSACEAGNLEITIYLVEQGANVNSHNDTGSALIWAVHSENMKLIKYLIGSGVDISWKNANGENALHHAKEIGYIEITDLLTKAGN